MAYKTSDKDYYIYSAWVAKLIRYLCLLLITAIVIVSLTIYKGDVTVENMKYILKNIDFGVGYTLSQESMQVRFTSPASAAFSEYVRGDIVLLSRQGVETYDFSGKKIINSAHTYSTPALKVSEKYFLTYDVNGKDLAIYNTFSNVYEGVFPNGIYSACINDDGSFSVATRESPYRSGVIVYNASFKEIFKWMSDSLNVTSLDMPNSKSEVIVAGVRVDSGEFVTEILCFDTAKEQPRFTLSVNDEFPLAIEYVNGGFVLITDASIAFYTKDGELQNRHNVKRGSLSKYYNCDKLIAVAISKGISDAETLRFYTPDGRLIAEREYAGGVSDFSMNESDIYVLEPGRLHLLTLSGRLQTEEITEKQKPSIDIDTIIVRVFASGKDEYILLSSEGAGKYS